MVEQTPWRGQPRKFVGSWQDAEHNAAKWLRDWGYRDATARPGGADHGIDVRATGALGQVKNRPTQVGRPDVQRFLGATIARPDAQLFFFNAGGFSRMAIELADSRGIALFSFDVSGTMTPINGTARRISQANRKGRPILAFAASVIQHPTTKGIARSHWRAIIGVSCLLATIGFLADRQLFTGPFALDALKIIGVVLLGILGCALLALHLKQRPR